MDPDQKSPLIAIVDDDESVRNAVHGVLKSVGMTARTFASAEEFLLSGQRSACLTFLPVLHSLSLCFPACPFATKVHPA